ncbi:hypothetical protein ABZ733_07185 [Streptomyces longwoodensis]|uniref:hypothetical protein n=1 Tax=Streptomyces longwoodensis TaxID=68231 RepID=UPI0033D4A156
MSTATAIVVIVTALTLASSIVIALRDAAQAKHRAAIDRVKALHHQASDGETCVYCAPLQRVGYDTTWPCDTIRALDGAPTKEHNA